MRPRQSNKTMMIVLACAMIACLATAQTTRTVPSPYTTIQSAIDASVDGDTVLVSPGTYFENIDFLGKAILVEGAWGAGTTFLDGQWSGPVVAFRNDETNASVLAGFTVMNGRGADAVGHGTMAEPGGIHAYFASPVVRDCTIENNSGGDASLGAFAGAGGVGVEGQGPGNGAIVERCLVKTNTGGSAVATRTHAPQGHPGAGGIHAVEGTVHVIDCRLVANVGGRGAYSDLTGGAGGIEFTMPPITPLVSGCNIRDNVGGDSIEDVLFAGAGGIHGASPEIVFCELVNNRGGYSGGMLGGVSGGAGGIFGDAPKITSTAVVGNIGGDSGVESLRGGAGGVYVFGDAVLTSCTVTANIGGTDGTAPGIGGAGGVHGMGGQLDVISCTVCDNVGGSGHDGSGSGGIHAALGTLLVENGVVWDNTGGGFGPLPSGDEIGGAGLVTVEYTAIKGGWPGVGNSASYPDFIDQAAGNYHLKTSSGCIDTGKPAALPSTHDIDGDPRVIGARIDMGADEVNRHVYPGSGEDLVLHTQIGAPLDTQASVRYVAAGDLVIAGVHSPGGTFSVTTMMLFGQAFATGTPPSPVAAHPELQVGTTPFQLAPGPIPLWTAALARSVTWGFDVPVSWPGYSVMIQGFALSSAAANGYFAATEGCELRFE